MPTESTSPTGRYVVDTEPVEVRAFQWVYAPTVRDQETGETIATLAGAWSLDAAQWADAETVVLSLRRFPGHAPGVEATVHCGRRTAMVEGRTAPADQLRDLLEPR